MRNEKSKMKMNIPTLISNEQYMGEKGLYLIELQQMRNNYCGKNTLGAGEKWTAGWTNFDPQNADY